MLCWTHTHSVPSPPPVCTRDIKPENVLLDATNRAKLADFGVTRCLKACPTPTDVVGTPGYQPPEMLSGAGYGVAADMCAHLQCTGLRSCSVASQRRPASAASEQFYASIVHDARHSARGMATSLALCMALVLAGCRESRRLAPSCQRAGQRLQGLQVASHS
jgi:serine/threonine protein kinase